MAKTKAVVSEMDNQHYVLLRKNVSEFLADCGRQYDGGITLLDVAPQIHEGAAPYFPLAEKFTLDIDPHSKATYIADICRNNESIIPADSFDVIVCTEVLEHVREPFAAAAELHRILKTGGVLLVSTPFNFRIHGPLPDCWRFTEHGLRALLAAFEIERLTPLETPGRDLMPIHYTVICRKGSGR